MVSGYWEAWQPPIEPGEGGPTDPDYYKDNIDDLTHLFYAFLTLDPTPDATKPHTSTWDGKAIYDSSTGTDIMDVLANTAGNQEGLKIKALIEACAHKNTKFIWAIGGWSDLTKTIDES